MLAMQDTELFTVTENGKEDEMMSGSILDTYIGIIVFFVQPLSVQVFFGLGGFVCSFVIAYVSFKYKLFDKSFPNRYVKSELLKEADYIQVDFVNDDDYTFIVKNKKFGVYSVRRYEIQLPAIYDWLSWKIEGQILNVQQNGRQYIMDIYGNELK